MQQNMPSHLAQAFEDDHILCIVGNDVFRVSSTSELLLGGPAGRVAPLTMIDLRHVWNSLAGIVGDKREFNIDQVATVAQTTKQTIHLWKVRAITGPSIRPGSGTGRGNGQLFSFTDLFAAALAGCLRRAGVDIDLVSKACRWVRLNEPLDPAPLAEEAIEAATA